MPNYNNADWIVSVDDHIMEPPDLWTSRLPAKYQDTCPRVVSDQSGDLWHYESKKVSVSGILTSAGAGPGAYNPMPVRYSEMRPSCYDPHERLKIMDEDHVYAEMVFPNFPRFCGQEFAEAKDKDLSLLCVRAYNDFILDEWCAPAPERQIPAIIIPLWDVSLAVKELRRCADKGARSVLFSEHPPSLGLPSIHDANRYWDPLFAAASEAGMPLSIHIGSSSKVPNTGAEAPAILISVLIRWASATTAADWMFCDALRRHPKLRVSLSEGGIGWLPPLIESASYAIDHYKYDNLFERQMDNEGNFCNFVEREEAIRSWPHGDARPIEVFRKHLRGCFVGGLAAYADYTRSVIKQFGTDIYMLETDFPHHDSSYPHTMETVNELLEPFSEDDNNRLRRDNAFEWYGLPLTAERSFFAQSPALV